jgi:hypothetical protein
MTSPTNPAMPAELPDDVLRYAMECSKLNNPEGARLVRAVYRFLREGLASPVAAPAEWCQECVGQGIKTSPVPPDGDDTCGACGGSGAVPRPRVRAVMSESSPLVRAHRALQAQQDCLTADDPVVEANRQLLLDRSRVGLRKYGVTLADAGLAPRQLMQHALEEALDLANYLQTLIQTEQRKSDDLLTMRGMADCMDMVRGELIEAGIIDANVPPMMVANAVMAHIAGLAKTQQKAQLYTCEGKGGEYEFIGVVYGAGTLRDKAFVAYRDTENGIMFCRRPKDFEARMVRLGDK